ncbi:MAG: processing protease [Terrestrivirus sp.]|uniref:Processing protease n=1 Tax=Terrestrivirus sp. TaxID=2487775 RepID=A0A3G4ZMF2_9VIRU|nr:MAG: processing protease [Terrestrivirus sp.]
MDHRVYRKILPNKMRLLLIPMDHTDTVAIGMFVKVGARYETEKNNGISHFLEHMMFKGTKKFPGTSLSEKLDNVGAMYNAETGHESTNYHIYGHKNDIKLFVDIMCEIYNNPLFREDDIITERSVVNEELNMYKDDPSDVIMDMLHEMVFSNSSLKMSILGTKKNIMSFTRDDLIKFRRKYYVPERTVMAICGNFGNFDKEHIFKEVSRKMKKSKISNSNGTIKCKKDIIFDGYSVPNPIIQTKPGIRIRESKEIGQTNIMITFRSQSMYSENTAVYELIATILGSGLSSILFNLLRNKLGIVYNVSAYNISYAYEGVFAIHIGVDNKRVDEAIKNVLHVISSIRENASNKKTHGNITSINESDVKKAKRIKTTAFSLSLQSPADYMTYYGSQELYYMVEPIPIDHEYKIYIKERIEEYNSITFDKVNIVIRDIFRPENLNILIYGIPPKVENTYN